MSDLGDRAARLDESVDALVELVQRHDPFQLIPSVSVLTSSTTWTEGTRIDDGDRTFTWEAKIEYLAGLALAGAPGDARVEMDTTRRAIELTSAVYEATHAGLFLTSVGEGVTDDPTFDMASYLMQVEHITDRMGGYAVHLEEINDAVFETRRNLYLDALGFCPNDVVRLVRRHAGWINAETDRVAPLMAAAARSHDEDAMREPAQAFKRALDAACLWTPDLLAETTGLPRDQIDAMLTAMSTEFGSQPDFRVPGDRNVLRKWPFIRGDGVFLVPTPWAAAHCVSDWLLAHLEVNPNPRLRAAYFRGRSDGAEELVRSSLASIFGKSVVHPNMHYDAADGHGEIDCLVGGGTPVVLEVKSQSVTDRGRRGDRARLERVAQDVLEYSSTQTRRANNYIVAGGRTFASKEGRAAEQLLDNDVADPIQVVVSFEGIDPLAISNLLEATEPRRVWVTDLADFLVVRDFLRDPGPFLHYAHARSDPSRPAAYMESDAVIAYLEERLRPAPAAQAGGVSDEMPVLPYRSGLVNDYYTRAECGFPTEPLGLGIPDDLRRALRETGLRGNSVLWWKVASAILDMGPADWARWKRFHRRNRTDRLFTPPTSDVCIVVSSGGDGPEIVAGDPPTLVVPLSA